MEPSRRAAAGIAALTVESPLQEHCIAVGFACSRAGTRGGEQVERSASPTQGCTARSQAPKAGHQDADPDAGRGTQGCYSAVSCRISVDAGDKRRRKHLRPTRRSSPEPARSRSRSTSPTRNSGARRVRVECRGWARCSSRSSLSRTRPTTEAAAGNLAAKGVVRWCPRRRALWFRHRSVGGSFHLIDAEYVGTWEGPGAR